MRALVVLAAVLALPLASAAPEQVHQGMPDADAASSRSVLWLDGVATPGASVTLVGPDGAESTVAAELVPGPSAGFAYEARLAGLAAGASYRYRVGDREFALATPAAAPSPFRIVALGDMGVSERAQATVDAIAALAPDLVLHAGDISYAEGNAVAWKQWFDMVEPVAANVPWMTAVGNHESGPAGNGQIVNPVELAFYAQRFGYPGNEMWYSFDWAGVHVVALDTYSQREGIADAHLAWLREDLAASVDAAWTVAFLHEPPYSSNEHGSSERVQDAFVAMFDEFGVDLVIAGHDHGYERSWPMRAGAVVARESVVPEGAGTVYVVTGGGGESLYAEWEEPAPGWSAARASLYHVVEVAITPDAIVGRVVPTQGDAFADEFRIVKAPATTASSGAGAVPGPSIALALAAVAALTWARGRSGRS